MYLTVLRKRLRRPVRLLVIRTDAAAADWAARPIRIGPRDFILLPDVIGPAQLLKATEERLPHKAAELLILAAAMSGKGSRAEPIAHALGRRLNELPDPERRNYAGWAWRLLSNEACDALEAYMSLTYQEYLDSPAGQLELRGEIESPLKLLDLRGIEVPAETRARIEGRADSDTVDRWFARAANASGLDGIFD